MFNYFLPALDKDQVAPNGELDHALLRSISLHLAEALADVKTVPAHAAVLNVNRGPSGTSGVCIAPTLKHRGVPSVFYDCKVQEWKEALGGKYWVGWLRNASIAPEELERWEILIGAQVPDDAGRKWTVPIARAPHMQAEFGTLPQAFCIDPISGEPKSYLQPSHAWLWELAGIIRDWYSSQAEPPEDATPAEKAAHAPRDFKELVRHAGKILGVNYRLSPVELNVLFQQGTALLTQRTVHEICQASFGWQIREEATDAVEGTKKKPAASSLRSTTGDETPHESPGIDLVAAP
jgi:hypothetical protein